MGSSVWGAVEVNISPESGVDPWRHVLSVYPFVHTGWLGWDTLFGRFPHDDFSAVAPEERGLPEELSYRVEEMHPKDAYNESYLTLTELLSVDWKEVTPDGTRVWQYREGSETGSPFYEFDELPTEYQESVMNGESVQWEDHLGRSLEVRNELQTREFVCRQSGWWWVIHEVMGRLEERGYPTDGIRVVTWEW